MPKNAADLKRFAMYKLKLQKRNESLSEESKLTSQQIDQRARRAVKLGVVNDFGNIIEREPWDFDPRKR